MQALTTDDLIHHELHTGFLSEVVTVATWLTLCVGFLVSVAMAPPPVRFSGAPTTAVAIELTTTPLLPCAGAPAARC
jgi:hypothetical protein